MFNLSIYNIKIDFDRSHDSYVFDKNTGKEYLDFFSMYSSLPLGYNHPILTSHKFKKEINKVSQIRTTNCEFFTDEKEQFYNKFKSFTSLGKYNNYHFTCTGALAVEAACKTAMIYKKENTKIISFDGCFHGITSFGNFLTCRKTSNERLNCFPNNDWPIIQNIDQLEILLKNHNVAGVIVEPIQATNGDKMFNMDFFKNIRKLTDIYSVPLIFDEIQTGFCTTGKLWYFEHLNIEPDIVIFGKKTQTCGIMVKDKYSAIFEQPEKLCITWDSDLIDMIRCKYIIDAINKKNLIKNANDMGSYLKTELKKIKAIKTVRGKGLILSFELDTNENKKKLIYNLYNNGMICNSSPYKTIKLRPNLNVTKEECDKAINLIKKWITK